MGTPILTSIHGRKMGLSADNRLILLGRAFSVKFTPAAGGSNVCEITLQVIDNEDRAVAGVFNLDLWLSDAASGAGLTATTASGTVAAKASSGQDMGTLTSKKALRIQTLATGAYILSITDTAKTLFYPCAQLQNRDGAIVGAQLVTGNYG